jgi:LmbE family N-acetylglucosaminyl deacetylase
MSIRRDDAGCGEAEPTDEGLHDFVARFAYRRGRHGAVMRSRPVDRDRPTVVLIQPHPDDAALSVGASLLQVTNPLCVVTLYSAALDDADTQHRAAEDRNFVRQMDASIVHLRARERTSLGSPRTAGEVDAAMAGINDALDASTDAAFLAPAGVARHVDHLAAHEVGRRLGPVAYWEDVAFWGIYGASVDDRVLFTERHQTWLASMVLVGVDVSAHIEDKATLLACYPSQSREVWRPIRYHWTAARELGRSGYCERFFAAAAGLDAFARLIGADLEDGPDLQYGTAKLTTRWATIGRELR